MSGLALRAVGWSLILAAVALFVFALLRQRRREAIFRTYLSKYGSKLFFSVHPDLEKKRRFSNRRRTRLKQRNGTFRNKTPTSEKSVRKR